MNADSLKTSAQEKQHSLMILESWRLERARTDCFMY